MFFLVMRKVTKSIYGMLTTGWMSVTDTTLVTWCFTCAVDSYMLWHAPLPVYVYRLKYKMVCVQMGEFVCG